jgi:hypothetical protein
MKAYLVSDIRDSSNEVVIAVTENSIKARSLAKTKYFKSSSYFDLRASRYSDFDGYFNEETIITGENQEVMSLLKKLGWRVSEEQKKTES